MSLDHNIRKPFANQERETATPVRHLISALQYVLCTAALVAPLVIAVPVPPAYAQTAGGKTTLGGSSAGEDTLLGRLRTAVQTAVNGGGRLYNVGAGSMEPGLPKGTTVIAEPFDSTKARIVRGDIIVFRMDDTADPPLQNIDWIKRVIAIGGDTVAVQGNHVFVNGSELPRSSAEPRRTADGEKADCSFEENSGRRYEICLMEEASPLADMQPYRVPEGQLFVLGDSRDNSVDSRLLTGSHRFGMVFEKNVRGIVHDKYEGPRRVAIDLTL